MNKTLIKWVAAAVLSIATAAPAFGDSVTRPGDTIGLAVGQPLPPGFHIGNTATYQCRDTSPRSCFLVDVPILIWSSPLKILGAKVQPTLGPFVPLRIEVGDDEVDDWFNPFGAVQLTWDLGKDWGASYMIGGYLDIDSPVAFSSASLNQRFGVSYTGNGYNLTANVIWGVQFDEVTSHPQISPCPVSAAYPHNGCNPDFLNVDLTATKRFGRWELGPVALYSTDLTAPVPDYKKQSQFAVGALVGYWFDRAAIQAIVTSNVDEENYGGSAVAGNIRITFPLGNPAPTPSAIAR